MKKIIMLAVAAMLAFNVSAADDDKKPAKKGRGGIQTLLKELDLTAEQKKAIAAFNKENRKKNAEARKLEGEERKAALKKINEARTAKMKEVLTEDQAKKLKELQAKARTDRKKKTEDK